MPVGPLRLYPLACDTTYDRTPVLSWYAGTAPGVRLEVASAQSFAQPAIHADTTLSSQSSFEPSVPLPYGTAYWRVASSTEPDLFVESDSFVVAQLTPPGLIWPEDGAAIPVDSPLVWDYSWSSSCPYAGGMEPSRSFTLCISQSSDTLDTCLICDSLTRPVTLTQYRGLPLPVYDTLYWRVQTRNASGNVSSWSVSRSFVIGVSGTHPRRANARDSAPRLSASGTALRVAFPFPSAASVSVRVYDIRGSLVRRIAADAVLHGGTAEIVWDYRTDTGSRVTAGQYLMLLSAGSHTYALRVAVAAQLP
jgi:hypothetical protein